MARRKHAKKGSFIKWIFLVALLFIIIFPFAQARRLTVDQISVTINNLPSNLKGMRILYLSDIHQGAFYSQTRVNDLVLRINSYQPDLVLLGGDYANNSSGAISFFQNLPTIHSTLGTFAVFGNHDRTNPQSNFETLKSAMQNANVTPLVNEAKQLRFRDASFFVAGVDDYNVGHPDVAKTASMVTSEDFVIFLTHTPDAFPEAFRTRDRNNNLHWFDLGLSGHTHGGQVTFFGSPIYRNYTQVSDRYLTGWLQENRAHLLVSNGVGTVVFPIRFFAAPQIHIITLQ